MRRSVALITSGITIACGILAWCALPGRAYVEAPHSLGLIVRDSTHIVLMEVSRVDKEKGLVLYKRVKDLKGKHPTDDIKHNIGKRGFHAREWQTVMNWAEVGKRAVFFHNGGASETCTGMYWYQCYPEGPWWGMSHAEPFLLRTFYGDANKLAAAVTEILAGKEVIVTCLADGNKNDLHLRKGKLQRLKASLKRLDYNARRDFVGFGGDGEIVEEFKTTVLVQESSPGWRFTPAGKKPVADWAQPSFVDQSWRQSRAPIGYGEVELNTRRGTIITEKGQPFLFRRWFDVPAELFSQKGATFRFSIASDDSADVYLNGQLIDRDPEIDHEFQYWNRDIEVAPKFLKPGKNLVAAYVRNQTSSSDLYFDMEIAASVPLPRKKPVAVAQGGASVGKGTAKAGPLIVKAPAGDPNSPTKLSIDKTAKSVSLPCRIAPRKLPNLNEVYPIEVIATYPAPHGRKAHETIVTFVDIKPSEVHAALVAVGAKAGKPALGADARAEGSLIDVQLEWTEGGGKTQRMPIEKLLRDTRNGQSLPPLRWHFTGSVTVQPDPERDDKAYGADIAGTLLAIFPVTAETVLQSHLTLADEATWRLEIAAGVLPKEGTPARLVLTVR